MRSAKRKRAKRTLIALLLMFVLSFSTVFADDDVQGDGAPADGTQTEVTTGDEEGDVEGGGTTEEPAAEEPDPEPEPDPELEPEPVNEGSIIQKGSYYYYMDPEGVIRKKAGFVTVGGKIYYVRRGGKIKTNATFKVNKKYYRANKRGVILTGVYKWNNHYYFSYSRGQCKRKAGFVVWKGNKYYIRKGGKIITGDGFTVKNIAYVANKKGYVKKVVFPEEDSNAVIKVARKQVGIMTGKTYWVWYYKTRFRDTDRTPWCGAFVAWVYNKAGLYKKISVAKRYGPLGYVPSYSRFADKYKKWINKRNARPGDIIVFGRNMHVGLVEGVYGNYIVTIEGNAGPTAVIGCGKPGAVVRKIYKLNSGKIKGVICVLKHK
ncbi:MAG: CHAP domain-containing protein [Mogibacterium sp.]|nr:CHAP domain-containing protein [Mogibacterium sp.]